MSVDSQDSVIAWDGAYPQRAERSPEWSGRGKWIYRTDFGDFWLTAPHIGMTDAELEALIQGKARWEWSE